MGRDEVLERLDLDLDVLDVALQADVVACRCLRLRKDAQALEEIHALRLDQLGESLRGAPEVRQPAPRGLVHPLASVVVALEADGLRLDRRLPRIFQYRIGKALAL